MNAFSKSSRGTSFNDRGSCRIDVVDVARSVEVMDHGVPTLHIEHKRVKMSDYAESLGLPRTEQYRLRDMLKSGYVPEEINVKGMLDNPDSSDTLKRDELLDRLFSIGAKTSKPAPAPVVQEAAAAAAQAVETIKND